MTTIRLGMLHPIGTDTDARSQGTLEWVATARRVVYGDVVLPAPFSVSLSAAEDVTVEVAPTTSAWVWRVLEHVLGGANGWRYLAVPDSTVLDYASLVEVDPATLDPITAVPTVQALLDAAAVAAGTAYAPIAEPLAVKLAGDLSGTVAAPVVSKINGTTVGNAATKSVGTTTGTVAAGDDSRIVGAAPLASPAFTGTPTGITKAHVGLGSVDNTSDTSLSPSATP